MCVLDKRKFRFTLWRKKCYKVFVSNKVDVKDNKYFTPFQGTKVIVPNIGKTVLIPENPNAEPEKESASNHYIFEEGFIFYFTSLKAAKEIVDTLYNGYIFEGYIPAFTRYAEEYPEGCARKVVLTKRIN